MFNVSSLRSRGRQWSHDSPFERGPHNHKNREPEEAEPDRTLNKSRLVQIMRLSPRILYPTPGKRTDRKDNQTGPFEASYPGLKGPCVTRGSRYGWTVRLLLARNKWSPRRRCGLPDQWGTELLLSNFLTGTHCKE